MEASFFYKFQSVSVSFMRIALVQSLQSDASMMQATLACFIELPEAFFKAVIGSARGLMVWLAPGPRPREDLYELDPSVPIKQ